MLGLLLMPRPSFMLPLAPRFRFTSTDLEASLIHLFPEFMCYFCVAIKNQRKKAAKNELLFHFSTAPSHRTSLHPRIFKINTKNDGLENVSPFKFGVSMLNFRGSSLSG